MNNEEKALKIALGTVGERTRNHPSNTLHIICVKDACLEMARWKDEQFKQLLIEKTKHLSPSAAQDSVKRCTIEEIYREMFNEEIPNTNPYIK